MNVSIIIVNYNTQDLTRNCIKSVFEQTKDIDFEVIVSDNGSTDGSVEMIKTEFPQVVLIENNANLGFGAANNRGLKIAKGKYVFYLNSDTVLLNNAVKIFFDFWESYSEKEQLGALGAWLTKDGKVIHSYGSFPSFCNMLQTLLRAVISDLFGSLKKYRHKTILKNHHETLTKEIHGYVTGADLFVKNDSSALFDERFFMYFEESDLQLNNFSLTEKKTFILSEPKIVHLEGGSDKKTDKYTFSKKTSFFYWRSCLIYFSKNYPDKGFYKGILKFFIILVYLLPRNAKIGKTYFKELLSL